MKLLLLTALAAVSLCGCWTDAYDLAAPIETVDEVDASPDTVVQDAATTDAPDAQVEASPIENDASNDSEGGDTPIVEETMTSYEDACIRLHGCLGIEGIRTCLLNAHANTQESAASLRFNVAMQSMSMQGAPPPGPANTLYLPAIMDCVASAGDCSTVRECVGGGAACDPDTFAPSCIGNSLQYCVPTAEGGAVAVTDCGDVGLQCLSSDSFIGAVAQCAEGPCDIGTDPSCDGDTARNCILGGWIQQSCADMPDTTCAITDEFGMDMAQCQGDGAECDLSHVPRCVGEDLRVCQGGKLYTMSCPAGGSCEADPESEAGGCWGSTLFCGAETCEGSQLTYCAEGETRHIDCKSYGFSDCVQGENGGRCVL